MTFILMICRKEVFILCILFDNLTGKILPNTAHDRDMTHLFPFDTILCEIGLDNILIIFLPVNPVDFVFAASKSEEFEGATTGSWLL
jgi:hypothetical protein